MKTNPNPYRVCDKCHQIDQAPRHQLGLAGSPEEQVTYSQELTDKLLDASDGDRKKTRAVMAHVQDRATVLKHLDCCAEDGCVDCNAALADPDHPFDGETKNDDLVAAFIKYNEKAGA
jgi:hypothetical protein